MPCIGSMRDGEFTGRTSILISEGNFVQEGKGILGTDYCCTSGCMQKSMVWQLRHSYGLIQHIYSYVLIWCDVSWVMFPSRVKAFEGEKEREKSPIMCKMMEIRAGRGPIGGLTERRIRCLEGRRRIL